LAAAAKPLSKADQARIIIINYGPPVLVLLMPGAIGEPVLLISQKLLKKNSYRLLTLKSGEPLNLRLGHENIKPAR
jgi:hypothetical protein